MFASARIWFLSSSEGHDVDASSLAKIRQVQSKNVRRDFRDRPNTSPTAGEHEADDTRTNHVHGNHSLVTAASRVTTHVLEKRKAEPSRIDMLKDLLNVSEKAYDFAKSRYPEDDERVELAADVYGKAMDKLREELDARLNP